MEQKQWNFEAEATLLGFVMLENRLLHRLPGLEAYHFYEPLHQRIFAAVERKAQAGEVANALTLRLEFDADPHLSDIGGGQYLAKLMGRTNSVLGAEGLAEEVVSLHRRRMLAEACEGVLAALRDSPQTTFDELAAGLTASVQDIGGGAGTDKVRDDYDVTAEILEDLKTRLPAFPTGLPKLDHAMGGGLYPGRSYGFAARKKVGKTVLASTISYNLNEAGVKHLFVAGEMGAKEIHERNLARALRCSPAAFRGPDRSGTAFLGRIADHSRQSNRCIVYHDAPGLTFDQLRRSVSSAVYKHGIKGVILDYWQLVGGKGKGKNTSEHLDEVAQWLADYCRQHKLFNITMAQINQDGNTRGGEGIRMAFDQVYAIKGMGEREDISQEGRWLQMLDTRYTEWMNVGSEAVQGLYMNPMGPFFEQSQ